MNTPLRKQPLLAFTILATFATEGWTQTAPHSLEEVTVYGEQGTTRSATKLGLTLYETPQTVTAVSRAQMDDFALNNIGDLLDYVPGVTVEEVETNRTYYTARGFDIVNFQYDGVGVPFIGGLNLGQQDTAIYEKVEVVKGAAGLITGLANPSATINYSRKRPTDDLSMATQLSLGQWDKVRVDGDVSGALGSKLRGRAVIAYDDADSYLNRNENRTNLAYGIVEFDLTDTTLLTLGHSYDDNQSQGVLWGALPLVYSDGSPTNYSVSTSNAPDWTFADTEENQTFVEIKQRLTDNWSLNGVATHNRAEFESELFYVYGQPDATTEIGLNGWASAYQREEKQDNFELYVSGDIDFAGQSHSLVLGLSYSDTQLSEASATDPVNGFPVLGADWARGNSPRPSFTEFNPETSSTDIDIKQKAIYAAAKVNLRANLALLLGARTTDIEQSGSSYGGAADADAKKTVPYAGVTYEIIDNLMLYGSYNEVFKQQTWVNAELRPLGSTTGKSTEIGLKKSLNQGQGTLTLALFQSEQENFGDFIGRNNAGIAIYEGIALESEGFEIEFSGELLPGLNIGAGFTKVDVENDSGESIRQFIPSEILKLSGSYVIPGLEQFKIGGIIKWQDDIQAEGIEFTQDAFTVIDLAAHYHVSERIKLSLNVENITDEKYLNSLYWTQAYYGEPRNVSASISWTY